MPERVAIRELARRAGVSDTAIRKGIADGRIPEDCVGTNPDNGRTQIVDADRALESWRAATQGAPLQGKRRADKVGKVLTGPNHARDQRRAAARGDPPPDTSLPETSPAGGADGESSAAAFQRARAASETYKAKLQQLEYEEKSGQLVKRDHLKVELYNAARAMRDRMTQVPDRLSGELAGMTDQHAIALTLQRELTAALEELSNAFERIGDGRKNTG